MLRRVGVGVGEISGVNVAVGTVRVAVLRRVGVGCGTGDVGVGRAGVEVVRSVGVTVEVRVRSGVGVPITGVFVGSIMAVGETWVVAVGCGPGVGVV